MENLEKQWQKTIKQLEQQFDDEISIKGILYLIGIQELNFGVRSFSREEKINVLHVATCRLLSDYGYYKLDRVDNDGWPHYKELRAVKNLSADDQKKLIKTAIINYLN